MRGTLGEVLESIGELDDSLTIFIETGAAPGESTPVVLVPEEEVDDVEAPAGTRYLLELFLTLEVIEVWSAWRGGAAPDTRQKCEAVVHYADNDAYLPCPEDD